MVEFHTKASASICPVAKRSRIVERVAGPNESGPLL